MRVQLRITRPRHPMAIRRSHEPLTLQPLRPVTATAGKARLSLQVAQSHLDRMLVRGQKLTGILVIQNGEQHTHALRR
jgi:hypothetical protein